MFLTSCTVGPDFKKPRSALPGAFTETFPGATTQPASLSEWWTNFNDPKLDDLIHLTMRDNLDIRQAASRVREARAQRGVVDADFFPSVDTGGSFSRSKSSENLGQRNFSGVGSGFDKPSNVWQAGFDAGWELDIFGGTRRNVEAAEADITAAAEDQRDVMITLLAEVARNYINLRASQKQIAIARRNIKTQQDSLELTQAKVQGGIGSDLDVARSEAQVATSEATIPTLEIAERQAMHALAVLIGRDAGALVRELSTETAIPVALPALPAMLPSELLRRRPDIRRAEANLHAAVARIGVATSDLFPKFSLVGSLGLQSEQFKDISRGDSLYWSIGPSVSWPIFDASRIRSNIGVQNYRTEQALAEYEKSVLNSLREVEDALVAYDRERARRESLLRAVESNRRAVELASALYSRGLVTFLDVLTAQSALFAADDALVQSDRSVSANLVALYKALGGGWQPVSDPMSQPVEMR